MRTALLAMERTEAIEFVNDEANWPPSLDRITRDIWRKFTPEHLYESLVAVKQDCDDPRADGRWEHSSSIPRHYRRGRR